jgi:hypothetical protein
MIRDLANHRRKWNQKLMARPDGFEPPTTWFEARWKQEAGDLAENALLVNQRVIKSLLPGHRCKCHH